jgi:hypothetical protein
VKISKEGVERIATHSDKLSSDLLSGRTVVDVALVPRGRSNALDLSSVFVERTSLDHPTRERETNKVSLGGRVKRSNAAD